MSSTGPKRFLGGEAEASAVLDFLLVLPFFTVLVLTVVQLALLVNAKLVVGYAAFAAARSAIVWIPVEVEGEPANHIGGDPDRSEKWERILSSARVGVLPIAASAPFGEATGIVFGAERSPLFVHHPVDLRSRVPRAGRKWPWASFFTDVAIAGVGESGRTFGPTDPVEVTVTHRFHLSVTLAGRILQPLLAKDTRDRLLDTITISESYALPNQGELAGM